MHPVIDLCEFKHDRHIVHVGPRSETVTTVLHLHEGLEGAVAEWQLIQVTLVDRFHGIELVGAVLKGTAEFEGEVVI